jgi:4-hydroxybenzoate polyprenyltransferase
MKGTSSEKRVAIAVQGSAGIWTWARALRVHQYVKNGLVLVPIVTAHQFNYVAISSALVAFVAFSLCASAVYVLNDIFDLEADRQHPTKKNRPLASGAVKVWQGKIAIPILLALGFVCAGTVSLKFTLVLLFYLALTTAYSISLKRKLLVDVVVLAVLYTIRVIAGAVAVSVEMSTWLLAFSMFMFLSLALMKRYSELALRIDHKLPDPSTRNYKLDDLPIIGCLAVASGFNAVTIFALYISSPAVQQLYARPELLWLACPVLTYWIARAIVLSHRRMMNDDPIIFAIKDPISRLSGLLILGIVLLAAWKI